MDFSLVQKTKVLAGAGKRKLIGQLLIEAGYQKAFVVYDQGVKSAGLIDDILQSLTDCQKGYVCYDRVQSDPPAQIVDEAASLCRKEQCDCVIAVGGGSCIDTAKGVTILRFNEGSILDYGIPGAKMKCSPGLIVIPTTSGTGSELSDGLIITDTERAIKVPILALNAMSEYAINDPELTYGVPALLTAATGMDVFAHAFETYTSKRANMITEPISEKIMQIVVEYLPRTIQNPQDTVAREKMACASSLGGWMLAQASAHVGHSIAHVLGANLHIAHGKACAYALTGVMWYLKDICPEKLKYTGTLLGVVYDGSDSPENIAEKTVKAYVRFRDEIVGLPLTATYGEAGQKMIDDTLVEAVKNEPFIKMAPCPVCENQIRDMLYCAMGLETK